MSLLPGQPKIAILVAGGFDENHITAVQKTLTKAKKTYKIVAPEQGLVNGWQGNAWGHYFTVDEQISMAMGSDYDVLIIPGGERGTAKLKANPHTRRIVNHFLEAGKPVAAIGSGVGLLALSAKSAGLSVCASSDAVDELKAAQAEILAESKTQDGALLTADGSDVESWVGAIMEMVAAVPFVEQEAA